MSSTMIRQAIESFVRVVTGMQDTDLEREDWIWREYDGVRFAFLLITQQLRELAVKIASERAIQGPALSSAQRILAQHHIAYQDLWGALVNLSNEELDMIPAEGEWPLRTVFEHTMRTERAFFTLIDYAVERVRSGDQRPVEMSEDEMKAFQVSISIDTQGTLKSIYDRYEALHNRILTELATIQEQELTAPSIWWEGYEVEVRFRLHRFDAHLREHTIQVDKTLVGIGHSPTEIERLLRLIYNALGEVEGVLIGAWDCRIDLQQEIAAAITAYTQQLAAL